MTRQLARTPMVILPKEALSPTMRELTAAQRGFVYAMTELALPNPTEAARIAGYGGTAAATKTAAKDLMANPKILAALREKADQYLRGTVLVAAKALEAIAMDPTNPKRFNAAVELLNRAELLVTTKHEVTVKDDRTPDSILATIREMARRVGEDPQKFLGFDPALPAIEGEFKEVVPMSSDGLEDVL